MIHFKSCKPVAVHLEHLFRFCDLNKLNLERKLRRDHPESVHHPFQAFGADQSERLCSVCVSHCQEKSRQTADMIPVIMSKTDHVDRLKAPPFFLNGNLSAFSAVNEQTASIIPGHQGCQPPPRERHHTPGPH